jgi:elongation factor Tu
LCQVQLPHATFKAEVYILKRRRWSSYHSIIYRPQFYVRTTDVTGIITLPEGVEMVMPGDNLTIDVALVHCIKCWFTFRYP